jgi:hypothetical protein
MQATATRPWTATSDGHFRSCVRCGQRYDWRKSASSTLKMTYCGSLCERADLGFTVESLLHDVHIMRSAWRELLAL